VADDRITRVEERVSVLARQVSVLADAVAKLVPPENPPAVAIVSWFDVTPDQAPAMLRDLAGWIDTVLLRYTEFSPGSAPAGLPACWYRHPDVVEELRALRLAWLAVYRSASARPRDPADWHDRLQRTAERLVRNGGRLWRCITNEGHRAPPGWSGGLDPPLIDD